MKGRDKIYRRCARSAIALAAVASVLGCTRPASQPERQPVLRGGAASAHELVDSFLRALAARDEAALRKLCVDEREYREFIIPYSVPEGQAPRRVSERPSQVFWQLLDTKNRAYAQKLIAEHGGQAMVHRSHRFAQDRRYAGYVAHGPTEILVTGAGGAEKLIRTGWVAELGGRYKFIGFEWD